MKGLIIIVFMKKRAPNWTKKLFRYPHSRETVAIAVDMAFAHTKAYGHCVPESINLDPVKYVKENFSRASYNAYDMHAKFT